MPCFGLDSLLAHTRAYKVEGPAPRLRTENFVDLVEDYDVFTHFYHSISSWQLTNRHHSADDRTVQNQPDILSRLRFDDGLRANAERACQPSVGISMEIRRQIWNTIMGYRKFTDIVGDLSPERRERNEVIKIEAIKNEAIKIEARANTIAFNLAQPVPRRKPGWRRMLGCGIAMTM